MTQLVQALVLGLLIGGVYALMASGLTLIFGVMNIINVAHGALLILVAYLTWRIWSLTGAEESSMEGMRGFVARHRGELDPSRTMVAVLESIGSPELILLEGEGMMRMHDYDAGAREALAAAAADAGEPLRRGLRSGLATDGLITHKAGLPTATLASVDRYKMAANYHTQRDLPHRVDYGTVAAGVRVCEALIRRAAEGPAPA